MVRFVLSLLLLLVALPVYAWNATGHRLVALIAWDQLSPSAQESALRILKAHPEAQRWLAHGAGATAFAEASVWPDEIRGDPRFSDDHMTPAREGFSDMRQNKRWHYVDRIAGKGSNGELDRQLVRLARVLADPNASLEEKAYALPWVLHLVGDIHQPLHVGCRDDEGGNRFAVFDPLNSRQPATNLHRWWDDLPGPTWLRGEYLQRLAHRITAEQGPPAQLDITQWRDESWALCRNSAYPEDPIVTPEFHEESRSITRRRLGHAGHRLGRLLQQVLLPVSRETEMNPHTPRGPSTSPADSGVPARN